MSGVGLTAVVSRVTDYHEEARPFIRPLLALPFVEKFAVDKHLETLHSFLPVKTVG